MNAHAYGQLNIHRSHIYTYLRIYPFENAHTQTHTHTRTQPHVCTHIYTHTDHTRIHETYNIPSPHKKQACGQTSEADGHCKKKPDLHKGSIVYYEAFCIDTLPATSQKQMNETVNTSREVRVLCLDIPFLCCVYAYGADFGMACAALERMYICVCVCARVDVYIYIHTYMCGCMYVCIYVCACVCVYIHMYVCMYVCMYIYIYI